MNIKTARPLIFLISILLGASLYRLFISDICAKGTNTMLAAAKTKQEVVNLFPKTPDQIEQATDKALKEWQEKIDAIIRVEDKDRTWENTVKAYDNLALDNAAILVAALQVLQMVSPDEAIRNAAQKNVLKIENFAIDNLSNNVALYDALDYYAKHQAADENLTKDQKYFLNETLADFVRQGLNLPAKELEKVKLLQKEIAKLTQEFDQNIAADKSTIEVTKKELSGLTEEYLSTLKQTDGGKYILGVDTPTYRQVMQNVTNAKTREKMYHAFVNRAYPQNDELLKKIITKRDQLAQLLGFESYAQLDIDNQMAKSVETAQQFIVDLVKKAQLKALQEFKEWTKDLPESVELTKEGKLKSSDSAFISNQYKKKYLAIDEEKIAEYFPMEKTVEGLLDIYEQFFNLTFKEVAVSGLWSDEVKMIEVYDKQNNLLGYFLLDLYPRANKYSHACQIDIIPATYLPTGDPTKVVALVIANFPKSTKTKPSLLKRQNVTTFFHEFGHAIHSLLGRTKLASVAGTNVKRDFVEMPSQMLEEWMWDKEMIKKVSSHYKTGQPLPDDLIDKILTLKTYNTGDFVCTQSCYALLSLGCFGKGKGKEKNPYEINKRLFDQVMPYREFDPKNHMHANFGHLTNYGAKYYGYLWSKVFALDLFNKIKKRGLLNPEIGSDYATKVIGRGGSKDPNELLEDFLGRKPTQDAFLKDLGL